MEKLLDLQKKASRYDTIHNEGGEGYNPYHSQIADLERKVALAAPRTRYDVMRDLEREDCSIARESGTYDADAVAALKAELAEMEAQEVAEIVAQGWTYEVTAQRRAQFNAAKIKSETLAAFEAKAGWTFDKLREAIALHNQK